MKYRCNSPVIFLTFNRLDTTKVVLDRIRGVQPLRLYIASDGPRTDVEGECERVETVRKVILDSIDWTCDVKVLFRKDNLGCRNATSGALDWFFSNEEMGIVLEDDCVPNISFFRFCDELLHKYINDTRVMCITGNNFQSRVTRGVGSYSYYFSQLNHCWGWASWRRAWEKWHDANNYLDEIMLSGKTSFTHNKIANNCWLEVFQKAKNRDGMDSWAYTWCLANLINNGLTVTPQVNLVHNIGFGDESTHTANGKCPISNEMSFPLTHPPHMILDKNADDFVYENHMGFLSLPQRVVRKLSSFLRSFRDQT